MIEWRDRRLWLVFLFYLCAAGFALTRHELWGDEIHSWNIAKASGTLVELMSNLRYEGHPPLWYVILWSISRFTRDPYAVGVVHLTIASMSVAVILFFTRLPLSTKLLLPFGYFFLFEYAALSRNYAIGILLAFVLCVIIGRDFRLRTIAYYVALLLLAHSHLLGLILALSIHAYFLLDRDRGSVTRREVMIHAAAGIAICTSSAAIIFPPTDSELNLAFWSDRWSPGQVLAVMQAPLRSFLPIPAWWDEHFWNTHFLLDLRRIAPSVLFVNLIASALLALGAFMILKNDKKPAALFVLNLILTCSLGMMLPLTSTRYVGFIFVGFIVALALSHDESIRKGWKIRMINILLVLQISGALIAVAKDGSRPFSMWDRVGEMERMAPSVDRVITDYWTLNAVSAFLDRPMYCVELKREISFLKWDAQLASASVSAHPYTDGIDHFLSKRGGDEVYLISSHSLERLRRMDGELLLSYSVEMITGRDGAIERGSNLYLYKIAVR